MPRAPQNPFIVGDIPFDVDELNPVEAPMPQPVRRRVSGSGTGAVNPTTRTSSAPSVTSMMEGQTATIDWNTISSSLSQPRRSLIDIESQYISAIRDMRQSETGSDFPTHFRRLEQRLLDEYTSQRSFQEVGARLNAAFSIQWGYIDLTNIGHRLVLLFIRRFKREFLLPSEYQRLVNSIASYVNLDITSIDRLIDAVDICHQITRFIYDDPNPSSSPPRPRVSSHEMESEESLGHNDQSINFRINNQKTHVLLTSRDNRIQFVVTSERGTQRRIIWDLFIGHSGRSSVANRYGLYFRRFSLPNQIHGLTLSRRRDGSLVVTEIEKDD
jgi:hypothetical protein